VSIGTNQSVVLNVPATGVASIRYATTLGSWLQVPTQAGCNTAGQKVCTVSVTGTTDTKTFVPGINAGNATVQFDALNAAGTVVSTASITLSITAPASTASKISLQSNVSVLAPSAGTTQSTATLTATVLDATNNPVGGAPVLFELVNSTGTGESISPVIATTNSSTPMGQAKATFTAGTSTTLNSSVRATIVGTAFSATQNIVVGGSVGSIAIGPSNKMTAVNFDTAYQLPVTIMVSDSNGNAVSGAVVSLSLWPTAYYKGTRTTGCIAVTGGVSFANEDLNSNLVMDAGEDIDGPGGLTSATVLGVTTYTYGRGVADGALWPSQAAAGSIPATVTTDASGIATFNWIYLKQYANWLQVRLSASTQVQGSQSTASTLLPLTPLAADVVSPCTLPDSPFN
jgi:protocatechuate 3,4-dioxygenase beta subunit